MIILQTSDGQTPEEGIRRILANVKRQLDNSGKTIQQALLTTVRGHFKMRYPGSSNFSPNNVQPGAVSRNSGSVDIYTKGIGRAYHNVTITPKYRKYLTVPIAQAAVNHKAADFGNLIFIQKKNGKKFLARKNGSKLEFLYVLCKKVFQHQDQSIMPTDQKLTDNILARVFARLNRQ